MSEGSTVSAPPSEFARPYALRNYVLTVVNGAMGNLADAFLNPQLILSGFLYLLTRSTQLIGLLMIIESAGPMWPQILISRYIEHWPRKRPFYIASTCVRIVGLFLLMGSMIFLGRHVTSWALAMFFVGRFLHRSGDSGATLVFIDMVGQSIDRRRHGRLFASRGFYGDALAMAAGPLLVQPILRGFAIPNNYLLLAAIGTCIMVFGWTIFCFIREEPKEDVIPERTFGEIVKEGMEFMRSDPTYRRLFVYRMLTRVATLTLAFYVPFGQDLLGAKGWGGLFVGFLGASRLISAPFWGNICDRIGSRFCLTGASAAYMLAPILALAALHLPQGFAAAIPLGHVTLTLPLLVFLLALAVFGLAQRGDFIADTSFLLAAAPPDRRCSYQAFLGLVTFPMTLLPLLAGWLADQPWCGLERLFLGISIMCIGTLAASIGLWRAPAARTGLTTEVNCADGAEDKNARE